MPDVVVIDYGVGNLYSVQRSLEHCGATVTVTSDHDVILAAPRVVLPGVGAFDSAMNALQQLGLVPVIQALANKGTPLLGICLGMQLLLDESEEFGLTKGLGLIPGRVVPIPAQTIAGDIQKIPHIGWNALEPACATNDWQGTILDHVTPGDAVYFVHSFMAVPSSEESRLANCDYGGHKIAAVIGRANVIGCQFHPEKSGETGLKILKKFCNA
ncbi:glutamine amidotransferase [Formivibrio citricus]|uniref:Imidazole glycerol phosphate synthase subunit HisH n=1 Tax=Formivibrio citricus TaxID=83765 RepID=A0A1I4XW84_9NEIS|nr:imidazole glycerol phosphate synthase subunit HisH [Formivibrio citricus]SFN30171.1 glutamine amidotransferase [Formivibrio citricus]